MRYGIFTFVWILTGILACARAEDDCSAPASWFGQTPAVPVDFQVPDETDDCGFYRWAWQTFLWSTQGDDPAAGPRLLDFKTPDELFPPTGRAAMRIMATTAPAEPKKKQLRLAMRLLTVNTAGGTSDVSATGIEQATSQGVVVDQNNRPLFYAVHINDRFADFLANPTFPGGLALKSADDIKNVSPSAVFPPGCLEYKSAWRILSDEEQQPANLPRVKERFFVTGAVVPTLFFDSATSRIKADLTKPRNEMVALVSLHVVGTITNHPEFIWASFEQVDNAPVLDGKPPLPNAAVDATRGYTFYRQGTLAKNCNVNPILGQALRFENEAAQTLTPITDLYRLNNSGDGGVGQDADVKSLNASVAGQLMGDRSVWKQYTLIGATWLKANSLTPDTANFGTNLQGEDKLSNVAMESFTQVGKQNCFNCHNTQHETFFGKTLPGLQIKISHVVRDAYLPNH